MSNKNRDRNQSTTPQTTETIPSTQSVTETAMVQAAPSGPSVDELVAANPDSMAHLVPFLPHLKDRLLRMRRVHPSELAAAAEHLTPAERTQFDSMMDRMSPEKEGMEAETTAINAIKQIKLFQGTGSDPGRPNDVPPGGFYVRGGNALTVPADMAAQMEMPSEFSAAVVGFFNGRSYFPAKDRAGNNIVPEGVDADIVGPICASHDRKHGSRYNECASCAFRPTRDGERVCKDTVDLFLLMPDLSGIYHMTLSSTSLPTAATPIKSQVDAWKYMYECLFTFRTEPRQRGEQKWFVVKASLAKTKSQPQGVRTTEGFRKIASYFARLIQTEWYFDLLARTYAPNDATSPSGATAAAPGNASAALEAARRDAAEDNSNNV